jgi:hypothetical protein
MNEIPSIKSLKKKKILKEKEDHTIFDIVLNKCIEKINYIDTYTKKTFLVFEVPTIMIGQINYNASECVLYLINKFRQKNYNVELIKSTTIYIDWTEYQKVSVKNDIKDTSKNMSKLFPKANIKYIYE